MSVPTKSLSGRYETPVPPPVIAAEPWAGFEHRGDVQHVAVGVRVVGQDVDRRVAAARDDVRGVVCGDRGAGRRTRLIETVTMFELSAPSLA